MRLSAIGRSPAFIFVPESEFLTLTERIAVQAGDDFAGERHGDDFSARRIGMNEIGGHEARLGTYRVSECGDHAGAAPGSDRSGPHRAADAGDLYDHGALRVHGDP